MGKGTNISFGIRMNCSFREIKLEGGGTQRIHVPSPVFLKMWIFKFCQSIFIFSSLLPWTTKTTTHAYTVITHASRNDNQQSIGYIQLLPHVLIHIAIMCNVQLQFLTLFFHDSQAKYFDKFISSIMKSNIILLSIVNNNYFRTTIVNCIIERQFLNNCKPQRFLIPVSGFLAFW